MVLLLAKNSKAGCLFRLNFLKQVFIEIKKMPHPRQKFSKYPPGHTTCLCTEFETELQAKEVGEISIIMFMGKWAVRHSFAHQHGDRNINVCRFYKL